MRLLSRDWAVTRNENFYKRLEGKPSRRERGTVEPQMNDDGRPSAIELAEKKKPPGVTQ